MRTPPYSPTAEPRAGAFFVDEEKRASFPSEARPTPWSHRVTPSSVSYPTAWLSSVRSSLNSSVGETITTVSSGVGRHRWTVAFILSNSSQALGQAFPTSALHRRALASDVLPVPISEHVHDVRR